MKMKNKQKIPVSISASREVFDYLKEKGSDRKTKTEAYCDLLDKASAGFVSPFLRKQGNELLPNQCHLTVSDLASEWHWHRATVRSFLDAMEEFGLLNRTRLPKSVIITMTVQSDQSVQSRNVQEQPDFADQFRDVLSDWVIGKTTTAEAGIACGQLVRRAMTGVADPETGRCPDSRSDMASAYPDISDTDIRGIALGCIAHAALQKSCAGQDLMTAHRWWISSVLISEKSGRLSLRHPKSLRSLFSTQKRMIQASAWTKTKNALNRFANPFYRFYQRRGRWRDKSEIENRLYNREQSAPGPVQVSCQL